MDKEQMKNDPLFNLLEIIRVRKIRIIIGFLSVFAITIIGVFLMPSVYEASTKISLNLPTFPKDVASYLEDQMDFRGFVANQPVVASSRFMYEKVVVKLDLHKRKEGPSFLGRIKNIFFKKNSDPLEEAIDNLSSRTDISLIRGTNIMRIAARSGSAEEGAYLANTLAKTYADYANNFILKKVEGAYDVIAAEAESARKALDASRDALNRLKRSLNILEDPAILKGKLAQYTMRYEEIQERIQELENRPPEIKKEVVQVQRVESPKVKIQPPENPKITELTNSLRNLRNELDTALGTYTEKHPNVKKLRSKIAALEGELSREEKDSQASAVVETALDMEASPAAGPSPVVEAPQIKDTGPDINVLKRKRDNLSKQIRSLENSLSKSFSAIEPELEKLTRDVNKKEVEYSITQEKLDSARLLKDQAGIENIKIMDPAFPPPNASNKKKIILLIVGFIASIIFGLGMGFVSEYLDDIFKSPEEVEKSLNLPVLATIPHIAKMMRKEKPWLKFRTKT